MAVKPNEHERKRKAGKPYLSLLLKQNMNRS